jgi:hypothetical protein
VAAVAAEVEAIGAGVAAIESGAAIDTPYSGLVAESTYSG